MARKYIYIPTGVKVTAGDGDELSPAIFKPVEEAEPETKKQPKRAARKEA